MSIKHLSMAVVLLCVVFTGESTRAEINTGFDHSLWNELLHQHVTEINNVKATAVDYQGMFSDREALTSYLKSLAAVSKADFDQWPADVQLAFLINAYNAWTVELILTEWPDIESIRDIGNLFSSPWSKAFVSLFGETLTLDDVEHQLIRGSERYQDPRIHFAVNCASIGCPALRSEAYTGNKLDTQLTEQTQAFLSDSSRNHFKSGELYLSSIFKWYREDFEKGWQGYERLEDFLIDYKEALSLDETAALKLEKGKLKINFLDYDWRLNKISSADSP